MNGNQICVNYFTILDIIFEGDDTVVFSGDGVNQVKVFSFE